MPGGNPVTDAGAEAGPVNKPGGISGGGTSPGTHVVCARAHTGLDIGRLDVIAGGTAFAAAWAQERAASQAPGLVLRLARLDAGPVTGSLGSVHQRSPVTWAFDAPPLTARTLFVQTRTNPKSHITLPVDPNAMAVVSFGSSTARHGFTIRAFTIDGVLTPQCDNLVATVELRIPADNATQVFGGSTVGALLGSPTVDTNGDSTPDAWPVTLSGTARFVQVEAP